MRCDSVFRCLPTIINIYIYTPNVITTSRNFGRVIVVACEMMKWSSKRNGYYAFFCWGKTIKKILKA